MAARPIRLLALFALLLASWSPPPRGGAAPLAPLAGFAVTTVAPPQHALDVVATATLSATLSAEVNQSTVTSATLRVWGEQTGLYTGMLSFPVTTTVQRDHALPFKPGERISVQATAGIQSSGASALTPFGWQFTAASAAASASLAPHPSAPGFGTGTSQDVTLGDLDGDGDLDAVVANTGGQAETVWLNDGAGTFTAHPTTPSFGLGISQEVVLGDLDGDGDLDAVVANFVGEAETVWLNDGSGGFSPHPSAPSFGADNSFDLALGDLDGDGDLDAVVANYSGQAETVWLNNGSGSFTAHPTTPSFGTGWSTSVTLGDLDGDGDLDALIANASGEIETIWLNDGAGGFSAHPSAPSFNAGDSWDVALGDLDGDEDLDAVFANDMGAAETVWLNDGGGSFSAHPTTPSFGGGESNAVTLGDLDGDGDLDALIANYGQVETVWLNDGGGSFTAHPTTPSFGAGNSTSAALGDLDGDGDLDALVANNSNEAETVWLNQPLPLLEVTAVAPQQHALDVVATAPISATLSDTINQSTVTSTTLRVWGEQTGPYTGTSSFPVTTTVQRDHALPFKPGETIYVQTTSGIQSTQGAALTPFGWAFVAAAGTAPARFEPHPGVPAFGAGNSWDGTLGDLDGDGDLDAVLANYYGAETVWLNNGSGSFTIHPAMPSGFGDGDSSGVALGDLDGDGDLDALVAGSVGAAETVWLNNGSGSFTAHPTTPSFGAGNSTAAALGDLDGDGDLDAIVANADMEAETVWLNDGSGSFTIHPAMPSGFGAGNSTAAALGDLDGDGDLDALVANDDLEPETVWLNDGGGSFSAHPSTPSFGGGYSWDVVLGDLDGDGDLDALVANVLGGAETVWLNDGGGSFSAHPSTPSFGASESYGLALGDLDGDGDLDALVANAFNQKETVWLNNGSGSFTAPPTMNSFGTGWSPDVALGDLDGDGDLDALVVNFGSQAATVWLNEPLMVRAVAPSANTVQAAQTSAITTTLSVNVNQSTVTSTTLRVWGGQTGSYTGTLSLPSANVIQRGHALPFKPGETIRVQTTSGIQSTQGAVLEPFGWAFVVATAPASATLLTHPTTPSVGAGDSYDAALGDLDGDGDLDAVVANALGEAETVWLNNGSGSFTPHPTTPSVGAGNSTAVALGDLDGDGDLDAVVANNGEAETVWLNDGAGSFTAHPSTPSFGAGGSWDVALGDLDGDGDLDAVVANANSEAETVWLNNGSGGFSAHPTTPTFGAGNSWGLALGDLDGDGDLDALIANYAGQAETVWLNDGTGGFTAHPTTPSFGAGSSFGVALGDLDGDGDLDALVANYIDQAETVWLNDGTGGFSAHPATPSFGAGASWEVALGDLDGDGDLDAVVANYAEAETVWLNDGTGGFTAHPATPSFGAGNSYDVALGDLDGDGDLDALVANTDVEAETVWLNRPVHKVLLPLAMR